MKESSKQKFSCLVRSSGAPGPEVPRVPEARKSLLLLISIVYKEPHNLEFEESTGLECPWEFLVMLGIIIKSDNNYNRHKHNNNNLMINRIYK